VLERLLVSLQEKLMPMRESPEMARSLLRCTSSRGRRVSAGTATG
jgi:hypothetical protein